MYFTKEDLRTIEQYLKLKSMRDSQFETLESSDLQSDDIMVVVHEDENRKITLADFINSATIATLLENRIQQYEDYRNQLDQELRLLRQIINNIEVGKVGIINSLGNSVTEGISQALLTYYINQFLGKNSTFEQQISTIDGQVTEIDGQITNINNQLEQLSEDIQNAMSIEMTDLNTSGKKIVQSYKHVAVSKGGDVVLEYNIPVITLTDPDPYIPPTYPRIMFISSSNEYTDEGLLDYISSHGSSFQNSGTQYTKTVSDYHYYVVLEKGHTIQSVKSDQNISFKERFILEELGNYNVYHYNMIIPFDTILTFTIK